MSYMGTVYWSHPPGWTNPVTLRASAALPAAGVWDATPTESFCTSARTVLLSFTYTRAAAGGAFDFQIQTSIYGAVGNVPTGAEEWETESLYASGAVVLGADSQSAVQREFQRYGSQGAAVEAFTFGPINIDGAERIRVRARESGAVANPGTLVIVAELAV